MKEAIAVQLKPAGKIYDFAVTGLPPEVGSQVVVQTDRGLELGQVVKSPHLVKEEDLKAPLTPIVRLATVEDMIAARENENRCREAFGICERKIADHKLDMKLVDVERTLDGNKLIFNFIAEERVDFRDLVKDLASVFHTRIELRQIGVRDEAKLIGGIGICGRTLCCHSFLTEFNPVSIKMAKEQGLSLNPSKISGCCGRLLCCLNYENDNYCEWHKTCPGCTAADVAAKMRADREADNQDSKSKEPFAHLDAKPIGQGAKAEPPKAQAKKSDQPAPANKGRRKDGHGQAGQKNKRPPKKHRPAANDTEIIVENAEPLADDKRLRKGNRFHKFDRKNRSGRDGKPPRRKDGDHRNKKHYFSKGKSNDKKS